MLESKTLPNRTEQRDLWVALACGVVAFIVYALALCQGAYPGQSAMLMATCTGIEPQIAPLHPLWSPIVSGLGGLHFLSLPVRLNLFSALCAALTVMMACRLMIVFVRETVNDESISDKQITLAARLAGLTTAVALAFNAVVLSAATRLQYQTFDILLMLAVLYLLTRYAQTGLLGYLVTFAFFYGVGMVESTIFITFSPLAAALALSSLWKHERLNHRTVSALILMVLLGLGLYVVFAWHFFTTQDTTLRGYQDVHDVIVFMWRDQFDEMKNAVPRAWILTLCLSLAPAIIAFFSAGRSLNNYRSWSLYFLHVFLVVAVVLALTGVMPHAPGVLPVATFALVAAVAGYLVAYWTLLAAVKKTRHDQQLLSGTMRAGKWLGVILAWVFGVFVVLVAGYNLSNTDGHRGQCADICAKEILNRMGVRTWIVTDGLLDHHLAIQARQQGRTIHLLCLQKDTDKIYQRELASIIEKDGMFQKDRQRMLNTLDLGVLPFMQDWFANDPKIADKVVVIGVPDLWYGAGLTPIPDHLFFTGARSLEGLNGATLTADHLAFWNHMDKLLPRTPKATEPIDMIQNHLRRHMGFVGNDLGVMLEDLGHTNEAVAVYERIRKLDPDNISVLFNLFENARRCGDQQRCDTTEKDLRDFIDRHHDQQYPLWSLSRYYGYIRNADLFAKLGWSWALSGETGAALAGIHSAAQLVPGADSQIALQRTAAAIYMMHDERAKSAEVYSAILKKEPENRQALLSMAHLSLANNALDKARSWLDKMQKTGVSHSQLGVEWAALDIASGELDKARLKLHEAVDLQPNNLQAWGMLASVMVQQSQKLRTEHRDAEADKVLVDIEKNVLSRIESITGTQDQFFYQMVKAELNMASGKEGFRTAREAYVRASILRPSVTKLQDLILQLDIRLADKPSAERYARQVLRSNRDHALANYVMGSLRLQAGAYGEAEDYLRRSVTSNPTPEALNDLAETLRRIRKSNEAEKFARDATTKAPTLYIAWETLGTILMDENRLDEAEAAMKKALALNNDDLRVKISLARMLYLRGNVDGARDALKEVREKKDNLSPFDLDEFEHLTKDMARHP